MNPSRATFAATVGFTAFAAARHDRRIVAYLAVVAVAAFGLWLVHRLTPIPLALRWAAAGGAVLHLSGGLLPSPTGHSPVLYETWLVEGLIKYDQLVHFTLSAILALVCWHVLGSVVDRNRTPPSLMAAMAVLLAVGVGALNEVFEFLSVLRFTDAYVGGLDNAGWDLVFNLFGAATAIGFALTRTNSRFWAHESTQSVDSCAQKASLFA